LGKVLGGTALAVLQAGIFLALAPWAGIRLTLSAASVSILWIVLLGLALTSLGLVLAWRSESVQGFHAIMSMLLFPMWFLSGSVFPVEGAPAWIRTVVQANPLTYGVAGLRRLLYWGQVDAPLPASLPTFSVCLTVTLLFAVGAFAWAVQTARRS
jgi:ABC-2 type transport system permease protein